MAKKKKKSNRAFAESTERTLEDFHERHPVIEGYSWGAPSINWACTGNPLVGVPFGILAEIHGPPAGGKTSLCLQLAGHAMHADPELRVGFVDLERRLNPWRARDMLTVMGAHDTTGRFSFTTPLDGDKAAEDVFSYLDRGYGIVLLDSLDRMFPGPWMNAAPGDGEALGQRARLIGDFCHRLMGYIVPHESRGSVICLNQLREKVGVMFGSPETTPGGKAMEYYSSLRLRVKRSKALDNRIKAHELHGGRKLKKALVGENGGLTVVKTTFTRPFIEVPLEMLYKDGFSLSLDAFETAVRAGLIGKDKQGYVVDGELVGWDLVSHSRRVWGLLEKNPPGPETFVGYEEEK